MDHLFALIYDYFMYILYHFDFLCFNGNTNLLGFIERVSLFIMYGGQVEVTVGIHKLWCIAAFPWHVRGL